MAAAVMCVLLLVFSRGVMTAIVTSAAESDQAGGGGSMAAYACASAHAPLLEQTSAENVGMTVDGNEYVEMRM